jgi:hypothetical protein
MVAVAIGLLGYSSRSICTAELSRYGGSIRRAEITQKAQLAYSRLWLLQNSLQDQPRDYYLKDGGH